MTLTGILSGYSYREAKGLIEALMEELNIKVLVKPEDLKSFIPSRRILITTKDKILGQFGELENDNFIYYEFCVSKLKESVSPKSYCHISKFPAQIEDLTLVLPEKTKVGNIVSLITSIDKTISEVELIDVYKDAYTFPHLVSGSGPKL